MASMNNEGALQLRPYMLSHRADMGLRGYIEPAMAPMFRDGFQCLGSVSAVSGYCFYLFFLCHPFRFWFSDLPFYSDATCLGIKFLSHKGSA